MNNRLPIYLLSILVLVALVWRMVSPPAPPPPGPSGQIPHWNSSIAIGDFAVGAVNPSGSRWAGAWNQKTSAGVLRSAIWIIDLANITALKPVYKEGVFISSIGWRGDKTVWALEVDSNKPEDAMHSSVITIDATTGKVSKRKVIAKPVARILAWPMDSSNFLAKLADTGDNIQLAVFGGEGTEVGKVITIPAKRGWTVDPLAALSPRGNLFVVSAGLDTPGSERQFFMGDGANGWLKPVFTSKQLSGRVDEIRVSPDGLILVVCSLRGRFDAFVYDPKLLKLEKLKDRPDLKVADIWPDAPGSIAVASYSGGYSFDLSTLKRKELIDLTKLDRYEDYWRRSVAEGFIYPRKDGNFTVVSDRYGAVDIRVITKDGSKGSDILIRR
jgi:hypothetical protein